MKDDGRKKYVWTIVVCMMLLFVMAGIAMRFLPDTVPMHFGSDGHVDRYGSKYEFFAVAAVLCIGPVAAIALPEEKGFVVSESDDEKTVERKKTNRKVMRVIGVAVALAFDIVFLILLVTCGTGAREGGLEEYEVGDMIATIMTIMLGLAFIPIGNVLPKTKPNALVGVRTSWSSYNDRTWTRSNRFGGIAMMLVGVITVIITMFVRGLAAMVIMTVLLLAASGLMIWYSYKVYKDEKASEEAGASK